MVSELLMADTGEIHTQFEILADNIFVEDGCLTPPGLIENIAQTAAVQSGYLSLVQGVKVPIGFIGAVQNIEINKLPRVGEKIKTIVIIEHEVFNASIIKGTITLNGETIASCKMKIFINS